MKARHRKKKWRPKPSKEQTDISAPVQFSARTSTRIARTLNALCWILSVSLLFNPFFAKLQILLCAALPLLITLSIRSWNGKIDFEGSFSLKQVRPNMFTPIMILSIALMFRGYMFCNLISYMDLLIPWGLVFLIFSTSMLRGYKKEKRDGSLYKYLLYVIFIPVSLAYSFGVVVNTNMAFTNSETVFHRAEVLKKKTSRGIKSKIVWHYLELSPWGPQKEIESARVSRKTFDRHKIGDSVTIHLNNGLYNVPYFRVVN